MVIEAAGATDPGKTRLVNQDDFTILPELGLCLVADGMGGRPSGDWAATMAINAVNDFFTETDPERTLPFAWDASKGIAAGLLVRAFEHACAVVHDAGSRYAPMRGMGTTLSALLVAGPRVVVAHVGDSRVYRSRGGALERLTEDHNHGEVYLELLGESANREVYELSRRVLSRAIGTQATVQVDVRVEEIVPGDAFLLCSDGLWGCLTDAAMAKVLGTAPGLKAAAAELLARANEAGGPDNITAVLVRPLGLPRGAL